MSKGTNITTQGLARGGGGGITRLSAGPPTPKTPTMTLSSDLPVHRPSVDSFRLDAVGAFPQVLSPT